MKIEALADADSVARAGAALTAAEARAAVAARGRFIVAFSGGHTPWQMLRALADEQVPWAGVHVVQVDERVAPAGDSGALDAFVRPSHRALRWCGSVRRAVLSDRSRTSCVYAKSTASSPSVHQRP